MENILISQNTNLTVSQKGIFDNIIKDMETTCSNVLNSYDVYERISSLTGSAGTGKTFMTVQIVKRLIQEKITCAITAPTHKAAGVIANLLLKNNINKTPKTIHSFLGIKPFIDFRTGIESFVVDKKAKKVPVDVLIVDESSMINDELFGLICEALDENLVQFVLFVGDPNQLLPVSGSSNIIFKINKQYKLTEIVRQGDSLRFLDAYSVNDVTIYHIPLKRMLSFIKIVLV